MSLAIAFVVAMATSYLLGFAARALLGRLGIIDRPNKRSSHDLPVSRGGGLAVLAGIAVTSAELLPRPAGPQFVLCAAALALLAAVSFLDDIRSMPRALRLAVQAAAAAAVLFAAGMCGTGFGSPLMPAGVALVGFIWITGYTNSFNFMDGINGLAATQAVLTGAGTALVALRAGSSPLDPAVILCFIVAGSAAGFMPHNFPRARMFLGDVGSVPLGFLLAVLAFWLARDIGWWILGLFALLHANFILDTSVTLARRFLRRENWLEPHREHFYQRLVRSGRSHAIVTSCEALMQACVLGVVLAAVRMGWAGRAAAAVLICAAWLVFFWRVEVLFRRSQINGNSP
jgi:UDP-N-acetylmuramyl pentapeptide phosphotransferase/UDP-N-acetylglucosamine-1-phosphate transferase